MNGLRTFYEELDADFKKTARQLYRDRYLELFDWLGKPEPKREANRQRKPEPRGEPFHPESDRIRRPGKIPLPLIRWWIWCWFRTEPRTS